MGLKPDSIENQKQNAERRLAARKAQLEAKGFDEPALRRDPLIRRARAEIRQASRRLARVKAIGEQNAELATAKAGGGTRPDKGAPKKGGGDKPKKGGEPKAEKGEPKAEKGGEPKPDAEA